MRLGRNRLSQRRVRTVSASASMWLALLLALLLAVFTAGAGWAQGDTTSMAREATAEAASAEPSGTSDTSAPGEGGELADEETEAEPSEEEIIRQQEEDKEEALKDELLERDVPTEEEPELELPPVDPDRWTYEWRNGSHLVRADKRAELHFGWSGHFDWAAYHLDPGLERPGTFHSRSDSDIRRFRPYVQGFVFERFFFKVAYEFAEMEARDAYVGMTRGKWMPNVQVGFMREPFSLEQATAKPNNVFMERSLANAIVPRRNTGFLLTDTLFSNRLTWFVGGFQLSETLTERDDVNELNGQQIAVRVTGLPYVSEDGSRQMALGFWYSHIWSTTDGLTISARPESGLVESLVRTPPIAKPGGYDYFGLESFYQHEAFAFQAEWIGLIAQRKRGLDDAFFWGGYAQVSFFITGEQRIYARRSAGFARVVPRKPFEIGGRKFGAFEVAARISTLDLNSRELRGGQQTDLTLGINWYLRSNLRFTLNYVHAHVNGQGAADIAQARVQIDF